MTNKLYFFANIGDWKKNPIGGGQTSARRVIEGFRQMNIEIVEIDRHWNVLTSKIGHFMENSFYAVINTLQLLWKLLLGRRTNSAMFHISYSASLIPLEFVNGILARMLGYKTILYLKGGKLEDTIKGLSGFKRWMFKKNLDIRSLVLFEGESDIERVRPFTDTRLVYFPNYIFEKNIPSQQPVKPKDYIGICHFGRITEDKNVHVVLDTFELLAEKYDNIKLTLVGGLSGKGGNKAYYEMIDNRCRNSKYANRILRVGQSSQAYIAEMLSENHIFLFPSADPCEGQSNSLNEAMTWGLVPIVSNFHFNKTIVADDRLVVNGYNAQDYANRISSLIDSKLLDEISTEMWNRIKNVYSFKCVNKRISEEIKNV